MTSARKSSPNAHADPVDKIAVDISIWLRALFFGGAAEELIKMALTGKVEILTTEAQFDDLATVLRQRLGFSEAAIGEVRRFVENATTLLPSPAVPASGPAADISPLLQAARDSRASAIATSHASKLMGMADFEGIPIVTVS